MGNTDNGGKPPTSGSGSADGEGDGEDRTPSAPDAPVDQEPQGPPAGKDVPDGPGPPVGPDAPDAVGGPRKEGRTPDGAPERPKSAESAESSRAEESPDQPERERSAQAEERSDADEPSVEDEPSAAKEHPEGDEKPPEAPEDAAAPEARETGKPRPEAPASAEGGRTPPDAPRRTRPFGGGILMGRPFGVPVYVAPSWFVVAALITWVFGGQLDRVLPHLGGARYLIALFFAVAFYASVLVHELAHTVVALRYGLPVRRIQLQFFGGVSEIEKESERPGREFALAFVGPLLSLVLSGIFYGALFLVQPRTVVGVLLAGLMLSNLIVAVFNLLPGLPLDGGRMLRALVWKISGKPMTGTVFAAWTGRALAIAVLIGLPLGTHAGGLARTGISGMDSLTDALLAAILAAIIWTGAGNSLRMARLREHLPELRARMLTRRAVPVQTDTPLSEGLRRANAAGARAMVVVDSHGDPMSVVRESAIAGVPEHRRPWVAVSTLAQELKEGMRVPAELAGEELLEHLRATPATEYLVVEETGEIYGVLSTADVERAFVSAMSKNP